MTIIKIVYLKRDVQGLERGEVMVAHWTPKGYHLYSPASHTMYRFAIPAPCMPFEENDWCALFKNGAVRHDERPFYLHPVNVPGFAYHGPWIYLDDLWLLPNGTDEARKKLARVLGLCGKTLEQLEYPQRFYQWFGEKWPNGIFLDHLAYLSEKGLIPD